MVRISGIIFILLIIVFYSCTRTPVEPEPPPVGLTGIVMDTMGNPIPDVSIYCMYAFPNFDSISVKEQNKLSRIASPDTFGFDLMQNFPNPVFNSVFFRFSIPGSMRLQFTIRQKSGTKRWLIFNDSLEYGYYQYYLKNLVDSLKLRNGLYVYSLAGVTHDTTYYLEKELAVVSNKGTPNALSSEDGTFLFDYRDSFIGDSVAVYNSHNMFHYLHIKNKIYFYVKKSGYKPKYLYIELYPDVLIHHDIILRKQ